MMWFVEFQLKAGGMMAIGVLIYHLLLSKDVSFQRNRVWLLACLSIPWLVPLIAMPTKLKTFLFGYETVRSEYLISQSIATPSVPDDFVINILPWPTIGLSILGIISLVLTLRLIIGYIAVYKIARNAESSSYKGFKLRLFSTAHAAPFSFFRTIYAPKQIEYQKDYQLILDHEIIHCKQWHSIDIILAECLLLLQWWNPFAWWLRQLIAQNHEYCVDRSMLKAVSHPKQYQYLIVDVITGIQSLRLINNFNTCFTKKRIAMMNKDKSNSSIDRLKMIPIVIFLIIIATAFTDPDKTIALTLHPTEVTPIAVSEANKYTTDMSKVFYIVDGEEMGYSYKLNPELRIESMNVIKPPMSVEEYGVKGKNGVVDIKTKKGLRDNFSAAKDSIKAEEVISVMGYAAEDSIVVNVSEGVALYGSPKVTVAQMNKIPMVIIDGEESTMDDLNKFDPKSIKAVVVLKDEAALKEYGDKGQHGVIKVTTKGNKSTDLVTEHAKKSSLKKVVIGHNLNEDSKIKMRFGQDKNPLLIFVDGKEMPGNTLDTIDPSSIESINVLKDKAAIDKYGAKAVNGAILITLKK